MFKHAPLKNSEYLASKFYDDAERPDEINLLWQILKVELHERWLKVSILTLKPIRVWCVVGGKPIVNVTGLYLSIKSYKFCKQSTFSSIKDKSTQIEAEFGSRRM